MSELLTGGLFALGGTVATGAVGWFIFWLWFAPLYHPLHCQCRRCRRDQRARDRRDERLARASARR